MKQETDDAILGMLLERNEAALEQIQSAYGKLCYKLADDILNNREDSEECVNDMLLKVWRTIPPKHPDSLLAYVITYPECGSQQISCHEICRHPDITAHSADSPYAASSSGSI